MRTLREWRYSSTHFLTSAPDESTWSASLPGCFTPRERAPGTHWIGSWVGPRPGLDAVVKRKTPSPCRDSNPRWSSRSPALYHWANPAPDHTTWQNVTFWPTWGPTWYHSRYHCGFLILSLYACNHIKVTFLFFLTLRMDCWTTHIFRR
jgi:hypothetical protein